MTIIETSIFTRQIQSALSEEDYRELQNFLVDRPDSGNIIKGSGGLRKLRWHGSGHGKRGGLRIIYYWYTAKGIILMLFIYPKSERSNLTVAQIKTLRSIMESEINEKGII